MAKKKKKIIRKKKRELFLQVSLEKMLKVGIVKYSHLRKKIARALKSFFKGYLIDFFECKRIPNKYLLIILIASFFGASFFLYGYQKKMLFFQKMDDVSAPAFSTIKISLVNDLHAVAIQKGKEQLRLMYDYQRRLEDFSQKVNEFSPDFVVANGDMIDGTRQTSQIAIEELGFLKDFFENKLAFQKVWTIGNHELRAVNREQWKGALGIDYVDKVIEKGKYKLIFLDSTYGSGGRGNDSDAAYSGALVSARQLAWLDNELRNSDKIKLIFLHFPPIAGDDVKIGYLPVGIEKLQKMFSDYGVAAVFSGHIENTLHKNIGGVDYYVLSGISKNDVYENAFSRIRMIDKKAIVTLIYKNEVGEYVSNKIE